MIKLSDSILKDAAEISHKITEHRRALHSCAEIGFDTVKTREYIIAQLNELGLDPISVGRGGIVAYIGSGNGKTVLLRADIDALPICEESGEKFATKNGNMHACGHDLHAAMLLGAAAILCKIKDKIQGRIQLCFQSAEETLEGARDMISAGLLDKKIDAALMIHVMTGVRLPCGCCVVCSGGVSAPSSDFFEITVRGKGAHGSTPHLSNNALATAARILLSIEDLPSREFSISDDAVLTVGVLNSGTAANAIPSTAKLCGTARAYDASVREKLLNRCEKIALGTAEIFGCRAEMKITSSCPPLVNDEKVSHKVYGALVNTLGKDSVMLSDSLGTRGGGSEDFAYISQGVPSVMIALSAGAKSDGYDVPLHNPKTRFDERALPAGAAVYATAALACLAE